MVTPEEPAPGRPLRFRSRRQCLDHAIRHVLLGRKERWHAVLDEGLIRAARDEWATSGRRDRYNETGQPPNWDRCGDNLRALAEAYERLLSDALLSCTTNGQNHWHCLAQRHVIEDGEIVTSPERQEIQCWALKPSVYIGASAYYGNHGIDHFALTTGMRCYVGRGEAGIRRAGRERARHRMERLNLVALARHD